MATATTDRTDLIMIFPKNWKAQPTRVIVEDLQNQIDWLNRHNQYRVETRNMVDGRVITALWEK